MATAMTSTQLQENLKARLRTLRADISNDPSVNPVRQVAHEISRDLEAGVLSLDTLESLAKTLSDEAFSLRAKNLQKYLFGSHKTSSSQRIDNNINLQSSKNTQFPAFKTHWAQRRDVIVFTGHPTFLLSAAQRTCLATAVSEPTHNMPQALSAIAHEPDTSLTLTDEHEAVLSAIAHASDAISQLNRRLLIQAQARFPGQWRTMTPAPINIASWVGYDMDGRTDIGWADVIIHRLKEKCFRLNYYATNLAQICKHQPSLPALKELYEALTRSLAHTNQALNLFKAAKTNPNALGAAADHLTQDHNDKTTNVAVFISALTKIIDEAKDDTLALDLLTLRADMQTFQLGAGEIHFRLNAAQVRNAARNVLNLASDDDLFGRKALESVQTLISDTPPVQVNFASLAIEKSSASRLFIAMSQILKHIDTEQPIRLLIAECENPVTVLTAIYLARLFGVETHVDICPLFETAHALDRSRRILDVLLGQPAFQAYAKARGRIAIQAGFSDAGRFMGQIPATLAIERLHGHFADLMSKHQLTKLEAVIFNTHGESMGRGNHQDSFTDRALYALSPWARQKFADHGIRLVHESSYQGGDGYVLFENKTLAEGVVCAIIEAGQIAKKSSANDDLFYKDISTSLDFYRTVKARQEALFADPAYHTTLSAFGLSLLPTTGSRKSKRQFERQGDEDASLRKIRAIPHNAILQQLGLLANLTGGIGQALSAEHDYFVELSASSDRFNRLMRLVARAKRLTEMKTFIAYMKLFDGSFWATRPLSGIEPALEQPCASLAAALSSNRKYFSALQLAARMRSDSIVMTRTLTQMGLREEDCAVPSSLDLLHAIRIATIQHLFILAARLPVFSPQAGLAREDLMEMIFGLHIPEAVAILHEVFPIDAPKLTDFNLTEQASYPSSTVPQYQTIADTLITPMEKSYQLILRLTNGISHHYGALG